MRPATGPAAGPSKAPRAAFCLEDFTIGPLLGEGSFSQVVLATLRTTGEQFALKIMLKRFLIKARYCRRQRLFVSSLGSYTSKQEKKGEAIRLERQVLDRLSHPGIVSLCFTFQDESSVYMGLELCTGGEILAQIKAAPGGRLPEPTARAYAAQLVDALHYLAAEGVVHRDLKPENCLLDSAGRLRLCDFGSAKDLRAPPVAPPPRRGPLPAEGDPPEPPRRSSTFVGTAEYVSPETLQGQAVTPAADLWSAGCLLFHMLAGRPPFRGASEYLTLECVLAASPAYPDHLSPEAENLIRALLHVDPTARLGSGSGDAGLPALKRHAFFDGVGWAALWRSPGPTPYATPPSVTDEHQYATNPAAGLFD